jgi:hypothetical protein
LASDVDLAEAWRISTAVVWRRRNVLHVLPLHDASGGVITWTRAMIRDLSQLSDVAVAQRYDISTRSVLVKREMLQIPNCFVRARDAIWTPRRMALLGRRCDRDVAHDLGVTVSSVARQRRILGIPRKPPTVRDWASPRIQRLLGRDTDAAVARRLGVSLRTVKLHRAAAGIPPYRDIRVGWTPAMLARLGQVEDHVIAAQMHVGTSTVRRKRAELGITSWRRQMWHRSRSQAQMAPPAGTPQPHRRCGS